MLRVSGEMAFERDMATKQSFLSFWLLEIREKSMIKHLILRRRLAVASKALDALRRHAHVQRQRHYLVDQGHANNNYHCAKKALFALSSYANTRRHHRHAFTQMDELLRTNRQRSSLQALY